MCGRTLGELSQQNEAADHGVQAQEKYIQSGDISSLSGIREILNDALGSVEVFERITIYAPDGAAVASVGESAVVTSF